jgi:hypothetical protein
VTKGFDKKLETGLIEVKHQGELNRNIKSKKRME